MIQWEQSLIDEFNKLVELREANVRRVKEIESEIKKDIKRFLLEIPFIFRLNHVF